MSYYSITELVTFIIARQYKVVGFNRVVFPSDMTQICLSRVLPSVKSLLSNSNAHEQTVISRTPGVLLVNEKEVKMHRMINLFFFTVRFQCSQGR